MLASARCGGRICSVPFKGSFIEIAVYADRLTVRFFGGNERTINGTDIVEISESGPWGRLLTIHHTASWWSPLGLYWLADEVKAAILRVKRDAPRSRGEGPPEEFWYS
jgi:hypothetical protein